MKYSLKTGRLKFEAVDKMITGIRTQKTKRRIKNPSLIIKRPVSDEKTIDSLNKQLSKHLIRFNKKKQTNSIIRIISSNELFGMIKRTTVYATAICMMLVLVYGSITSLNLTFAKQVIANGVPVGIVKDVDEFEENVNELEAELAALSEGNFDDPARLVYITRLCFEKDVTPEAVIMQNMMSTYDETALAYALYIDGNLVCAMKNEDELSAVLDEYKKGFAIDAEGAVIGFNQQTEIKHEYVPIAYLSSQRGVMSAITRTKDEIVEYVVKDGDTMWDIATKCGMSVDEIMEINPDMTDLIRAGDVLKLNESEPLLQVKVSYTETVEKPIPYENETVTDNTMRKGLTQVVIQGVDGKKKVKQEVVIVNGKKVAVNVLEEDVLQEAVKGKIKVGTKIVAGVGTGSFSRPAYGTITARYGSGGSRWSSGRHTGMDIAAPTGTAIYASDAGKVTFSGWKGSYGYMVIINHGNGYETYYGHCSKLLVKAGETVSKGDLIARVGSTGNSTGSHCHFEVRYNGVTKNPENYLR